MTGTSIIEVMNSTTEEAVKSPSEEVDKEWWKVWKNRRYILSIMVCLGTLNMFATRSNFAVATVAMTELKNITGGYGLAREVSEFNWNSKQRGYLLGAFYYGYAAMQLPAGLMLKRISGHIAFGVGVVMPGIITLVTPLFAKNFIILLISRVLIGCFQAVFVPSILSFWITWAPPLERARLQGIALSGAFMSPMVTFPLAGQLAQAFGWKSPFYVFGGASCVWYLAWLILIRESPDKDPFISERERSYIKRAIGAKQRSETPPVPWLQIFLSMPVWAVFMATFSYDWGCVTMTTQLPSYLRASVGFDLKTNGLFSALPYLTMALMSLVAGYLADIFLIKKWLTVTQMRKYSISIALTLQMIFLLMPTFLEAKSVCNILCICLGVGFGAFTYSGVSLNYVDLAPQLGPIIGAMGNTIATLSGLLSPIMTGFIVLSESGTEEVKHEWKIIFFIAAGLYAIGAVFYWIFGSAEEQEWSKEKQPLKNTTEEIYVNPVFETIRSGS